MSVYCFGKIIADGPLEDLGRRIVLLGQASNIEVRLGPHEPDDEEVLNEPSSLHGDGIVFNLFTPKESDIVALYNEATDAGRRAIVKTVGEGSLPYSWEQARTIPLPDEVLDAVKHSRLGKFVTGFSDLQEMHSAGLALFDNGVEQIIQETAGNCLILILRSLLVSWDLGPSALFVWTKAMSRGLGQPLAGPR